jgi:predicted permease
MSQADLIYRILAIIFPVFSIVAVGYFYARFRHDTDMSSGNRINMDIFTPALIFDYMSGNSYALSDYLYLSIGCTLVVLGSGLIAWPVARLLGYQQLRQHGTAAGCADFRRSHAAGGYPVTGDLELFPFSDRTAAGDPALVAEGGCDQSHDSGHRGGDRGIGLGHRISIPLMLFSLGVRMIAIDFSDWKISSVGSLLCPLSGLAIALPFVLLMPLSADQASLLLLFSVLPPAVLNFMVAERYGQEPHRVASIVLVGNLASVLVIPITLWFIL